MKSKNQTIAAFMFLFLSVMYLSFILYQNRTLYTDKYDAVAMKKMYEQSQWQQSQNISPIKVLDAWAVENHYTGWSNFLDENQNKTDTEKVKTTVLNAVKNKAISDASLYAYTGYEYVRGANPSLLNPEHPPLGKYLIGLSILMFGNEHVVLVLTGLLILFLTWILVYFSTGSQVAPAVAVLLTAANTLFIDQLIHGPQLEIFQVFFLLLTVLFLVLFEENKTYLFLVLAGATYGMLLSVKTVFSHLPLFGLWLFILTFYAKNFKWRQWIMLHAMALTVFLLTYFSFFIQGGTVRQWLGVQKYIVLFYKQSGIPISGYMGNYLRLIFTGYWKFWSEGSPITFYRQWSPVWPVIFTAGIVAIISGIKKRKKSLSFFEYLLICFILPYNVFLFITPMFPRYLLLMFVGINIFVAVRLSNYLTYAKKK